MTKFLLYFPFLLMAAQAAPTMTEGDRRVQARLIGKRIERALNLHYVDRGYYPTTEAGLQALDVYLTPIPKDPWGRSWIYEGKGRHFTLGSMGADGRRGGTGENLDIVMIR